MYQQYHEGWIEVITGCMYAGKTEELIRRIKVLQYAKKSVQIFKPNMDNRYSEIEIVSHTGQKMNSIAVSNARELKAMVDITSDAIAIDEVQFFDDEIVTVCNDLADMGKRVMVAGLDLDFRAIPFGVMPKLLASAEFVTKLTAVCTICGAPATRSQRLKSSDEVVLLGAKETYEARCRHCHEQ